MLKGLRDASRGFLQHPNGFPWEEALVFLEIRARIGWESLEKNLVEAPGPNASSMSWVAGIAIFVDLLVCVFCFFFPFQDLSNIPFLGENGTAYTLH